MKAYTLRYCFFAGVFRPGNTYVEPYHDCLQDEARQIVRYFAGVLRPSNKHLEPDLDGSQYEGDTDGQIVCWFGYQLGLVNRHV